jgi:4-diphosphocytidyl-2-C-methyl-D-erythritol kinase
MTQTIRVAAPAKINLYLHVVGRRPDGYHLLDSLVVFADLGEMIEARPADRLSLAVDGPFADKVPAGEDNLVLRAGRALADLVGEKSGAAIRLAKKLPAASGIGGGSADAAATLRALLRLWDAHADEKALFALALRLGADVPACLFGRPAFMGGIGEELAPAPSLPKAFVVLANPGEAVSTPEVFRRRAGPFSQPARFSEAPGNAADLARRLEECANDLEAPARELCPAIGAVLAALRDRPGALIARMSGSGATCFGLFADEGPARAAAHAVARAHPAWWVEAGALQA